MLSDWLSNVVQVVLTVSAAIGAVAAWRGVSTWRRELKGRTEYDLARRVLTGVYRVRDAIGHVRSPMMLSSEYLDRPGRKADAQQADAADYRYAYGQRWSRIQDAMSSLEVDVLEAEAIWHDELRECTACLKSCVSELFAALWSHLRSKHREAWEDAEDPKFIRELERIIWPVGQPDGYGEKLSGAVASFENFCSHTYDGEGAPSPSRSTASPPSRPPSVRTGLAWTLAGC